VVVDLENPDLKLTSNMPASVQLLERHRNVLCVPFAALMWTPQSEQVTADARARFQTMNGPRAPGSLRECLWIKAADGRHVRPLDVQIGGGEADRAEISGPDVKEGLEIVIGEQPAP
jgi:hypothetical protein